MKKLLLTIAVASLAVTSGASAATGRGGKEGKGTKTETEKREEQRRSQQAGTAGSAAINSQAQSIANQLITKTRVATGSGVKVAQDRLAQAVNDGILTVKDLEVLETNSSKEVVFNYTSLITVAAMKGVLKRDAANSDITASAEGLAKFGRIEVVNNLSGKTPWSVEAEAKLNTTLIESTRALKDGDATTPVQALIAGLKKAGFTEERIKEILKECFGIKA